MESFALQSDQVYIYSQHLHKYFYHLLIASKLIDEMFSKPALVIVDFFDVYLVLSTIQLYLL